MASLFKNGHFKNVQFRKIATQVYSTVFMWDIIKWDTIMWEWDTIVAFTFSLLRQLGSVVIPYIVYWQHVIVHIVLL